VLRVIDCRARVLIPQATERQRIGNQIDAASILAGGGLGKRAWNTLRQWGRLVWIIDLDLLHDTMSEVWLFAVAD
jgi:hypothetical protein